MAEHWRAAVQPRRVEAELNRGHRGGMEGRESEETFGG